MPTYNKLVRDKIPEIIHESGKIADYYTSGQDEYKVSLYAKMEEELKEFAENPCVEEAADMWEVFTAICKVHEISLSDVFNIADDKAQDRGRFDEGIILVSVQDRP